MTSTLGTVRRRYPDVELGRGLLGALLHPFHRRHRSRFPPAGSLRAMLRTLPWPDGLEFLHNHPHGLSTGRVDNAQGVAHDERHWFLSTHGRVWKVPVDVDLDDLPDLDLASAGIPIWLADEGYDHYGDLDHHEGLLYVPLEHTDKELPPRVVVLGAESMAVLAVSAPVPIEGGHVPWCALHPDSGVLHTSPFEDVAALRCFAPHLDAPALELVDLGSYDLLDADGGPVRLARVQGGAFSPAGHLYLVSDVREGGLMGFDMVTGRRVLHETIDYDPSHIPGTDTPEEELEGVTVWDLDGGEAPGVAGQLHLVVLGNNIIFDDVIWFKHFRAQGGPAPT